jgi:hypothetical protein
VRVALCALLVCAPATAAAWTEARPISTEGRAVAHADGTADVSYRVIFLIEAGWFRGFTLAGLPGEALLDGARCRAIDEAGSVFAVRVRGGTGDRRGSFWIDLDTQRGVGQGQLVVELGWTAPLQVTRTEDGTVWEWETPPWSNGMNGVTASLDLPFPLAEVETVTDGPEPQDPEAEPVEPAQGALQSDAVSALDEAHTRVSMSTFRLPRWTSLRVRARVRTAPVVTAAEAPTPSRVRRGDRRLDRRVPLAIGGAVALVILLVLAKRWSTRAVARRAGAVALDATLPALGRVPRFVLAAALLGTGLVVQLPPIGQLTLGIASILAAMVLVARRYERAVVARPPGRWIALGPEAVGERIRAERQWRRRLGSSFDATCPRGFVLLVFTGGAAIWAAGALRPIVGWLAWALALDALAVLLPLFLGATRRSLPVDLGGASARMLARYGRRAKRLLRRHGGGEFSLLGRQVGDGEDVSLDELRLELVPARGPEGLLALELGTEVWCGTPRLAAIVRTAAGSPADALARTLRGASERTRGPDGASLATMLVPGLDGHAGLFRDLRRALQTFAKAASPPGSPSRAPADAAESKGARAAA